MSTDRLITTLIFATPLLAAGCIEQGLTASRKDAIAVVLGDFDDLTTSLVTLDIASDPWDGFIVQATYSPADDRLVRGDMQQQAENLLADLDGAGDIDLENYGTLLISSGTRGLGRVQYNDGTLPDDNIITSAGIENVCAFAEQGGLLVVTDWAYDVVEHCWPDSVEFIGDDTVVDAAQTGVAASAVVATVNDEVLKADIGDVVSLNYDYSAWAVIESVGVDTEVLLSADIAYQPSETENATTLVNAPTVVRFTVGQSEGQVVYSTFHFSAQNPTLQQALLLDGMAGLTRGGGSAVDTGGSSGS